MKKKILTMGIALMAAGYAHAQTSTWYFGANAGLTFNSSGSTSTASGSAMSTNEGCTGVTDNSNNVIFYADGQNIWDGGTHSLLTSSLLGGASSTQAALIVPIPGEACSKFLVFTTPGVETAAAANGLGVCLVNVTGSTAPYTVSPSLPAQSLSSPTLFAEKLACTPDNSGGFWVVAHDYSTSSAGTANTYYVYHITTAFNSATTTAQAVTLLSSNLQTFSIGVHHRPNPAAFYNAQGQMKFNKAGNRLGIVLAGSREVDILNFNNATGALTIDKQFTVASSNANTYGLEFAPSSTYVYIAEGFGSTAVTKRILQYDYSVAVPTSTTVTLSSGTSYTYNALQLGPNDDIYVAGPSTGASTLSVIASPDNPAATCAYSANSVAIAGTRNLGLPTVIASAKSCSNTTPSPCYCPEVFANKGSVTFAANGASSATFTINSGGTTVKKVRAVLTAWNTSLSSQACRDYCNLTPSAMGNFTSSQGAILGFTSQLGSANGSVPNSFANEVTWTTTSPRVISSESLTLNLQFPPILSLNCCSQSIEYCIRFEFYDTNCKVCDVYTCTSGATGVGKMANPNQPVITSPVPLTPPSRPEPGSTLEIMPNPNNGTFIIRMEGAENAPFEVYSEQGRLMHRGRLDGSRKEVNEPSLKKGTYIIKVMKGDEQFTQKMIIN